MEIFLRDLDGVVLNAVSVPLVGHLLGHQLLKDEEQQLIVVSAEGQVAGERLRRQKWLLACELKGETLQEESQRVCIVHL